MYISDTTYIYGIECRWIRLAEDKNGAYYAYTFKLDKQRDRFLDRSELKGTDPYNRQVTRGYMIDTGEKYMVDKRATEKIRNELPPIGLIELSKKVTSISDVSFQTYLITFEKK